MLGGISWGYIWQLVVVSCLHGTNGKSFDVEAVSWKASASVGAKLLGSVPAFRGEAPLGLEKRKEQNRNCPNWLRNFQQFLI